MTLWLRAAFIGASSFPLIAVAEIADKEPAFATNLIVSTVAILVSLAITRFRWRLFPLALIIIIGAHLPILTELYDNSIGRSIYDELGPVYFWQPPISTVLGIVSVATCALIRYRADHFIKRLG